MYVQTHYDATQIIVSNMLICLKSFKYSLIMTTTTMMMMMSPYIHYTSVSDENYIHDRAARHDKGVRLGRLGWQPLEFVRLFNELFSFTKTSKLDSLSTPGPKRDKCCRLVLEQSISCLGILLKSPQSHFHIHT
jgi:hypothetical protein